eukprot:13994724-Heterocapsa_arctica.AAC.1
MAYLQQIDTSERAVKIMGICHSRGLAYQIKHEFERFAKYFQDIETAIDASEAAVHSLTRSSTSSSVSPSTARTSRRPSSTAAPPLQRTRTC